MSIGNQMLDVYSPDGAKYSVSASGITAGFIDGSLVVNGILPAESRAIAEAVSAERERCAALCERMANEYADYGDGGHPGTGMDMCAAAIRGA